MPSIPCTLGCPLTFPTRPALDIHLRSSLHAPRPYCGECIEWFPSPSALAEHLANSPAHQSSFPDRSSSFANSSSFARSSSPARPSSPSPSSSPQASEPHSESKPNEHTPTPSPPLAPPPPSTYRNIARPFCDDCVLWFDSAKDLQAHFLDPEQHVSHFACVDCGREFVGRRELEAHLTMGMLCALGFEGGGDEDKDEDGDEDGEDTPKGSGSSVNSESGDVGDDVQGGSEEDDEVLLGASYFFFGRTEAYTSPGPTGSGTSYTHAAPESYSHSTTQSSFTPTSIPSSSAQRSGTSLRFKPSVTGSPFSPLSEPQPSASGKYPCLDTRCYRSFKTASALLQHLDSGTCISGINRHIVNDATISSDHNSLITNHALRGISHPSTTQLLLTDGTKTRRTPDAALSCPLCMKTFKSPKSLHSHMTSPIHDSKIYHCPTTTATAKNAAGETVVAPDNHANRRFVTLGALAQHLESRGCATLAGPGRFNSAMNEVQSKLRQVAAGFGGRAALQQGPAVE